MRKKVYLLVFDGLADWEPALALCEINKSRMFEIVTVGFSAKPVTTMGGLKILPAATIDDVAPSEAALFIMPGGMLWELGSPEGMAELLARLAAEGVWVAAICGATLEVARSGLTAGRRHTSNFLGYLKNMLPDYCDEALYVNEPAVSDRGLITASGLASVEFACAILGQLGIYSSAELDELFAMFKHGVIPARYLV